MQVLIVDDEPLVRKSLGRAFRARGHSVFEAEDGRKGLGLWLEHWPDVALVDVLMPGLSGPEVIREVRMRTPQGKSMAKVILMSAYSGDHDLDPNPRVVAAAAARQVDADLFVHKPFENVFQMVDRAEELFGKQRENK